MPGLQPERADIIVKGVLIILLLMDYLNKNEITVSEKDILDGIIKVIITGHYRRIDKSILLFQVPQLFF
jgi:exopolyphosphatase/pppGpp-phosphohydrolase